MVGNQPPTKELHLRRLWWCCRAANHMDRLCMCQSEGWCQDTTLCNRGLIPHRGEAKLYIYGGLEVSGHHFGRG